MRDIRIIFVILFSFSLVKAQNVSDLHFGTDNSLEIISWNIEFFPHNDAVTVNKLKALIPTLDADIIAFQEVAEVAVFKQMINEIEGYNAYVGTTDDLIKLAYVYKTSTVQVNAVYEIFKEQEYDLPFYRRPYVMEFTFNNEEYVSINNHLKARGDGLLDKENEWDEENRRWVAINLLKDYIDTNFPLSKVLVMGDLNDILTDDFEHNVFQSILNDFRNYAFADIDIAKGPETEWSYPSWPSHIDHIIITNELFNTFNTHASSFATIRIEDYLSGGWQEYRNDISDHRAIGIRLFTGDSLLFYKNFEDQDILSGGWTSYSTTGAQNWHVPATTFGHNNSYCGFISGYNNGFNENEDWLVSPAFNADELQNLNLSFWNTVGYAGPGLTLLFSNDFTDSPQTATWTPVPNTNWSDGDPFWEWTYSGLLKLSEFSGESARIAFKYTSDANAGATWELDEIRLSNDINIIDIAASANVSEAGSVNGGGTFIYGDPVALEALPNTGYHFSNWTEGETIVSTIANYNFTANGNRTLMANFETAVYVDHAHNTSIKVYPNPASSELNIAGNNIEQLLIYDIWGRQVKAQFIYNTYSKIDIENLTKGIYIITVKTDTKVLTKRITKL